MTTVPRPEPVDRDSEAGDTVRIDDTAPAMTTGGIER